MNTDQLPREFTTLATEVAHENDARHWGDTPDAPCEDDADLARADAQLWHWHLAGAITLDELYTALDALYS